jgi:hypothetical protein
MYKSHGRYLERGAASEYEKRPIFEPAIVSAVERRRVGHVAFARDKSPCAVSVVVTLGAMHAAEGIGSWFWLPSPSSMID